MSTSHPPLLYGLTFRFTVRYLRTATHAEPTVAILRAGRRAFVLGRSTWEACLARATRRSPLPSCQAALLPHRPCRSAYLRSCPPSQTVAPPALRQPLSACGSARWTGSQGLPRVPGQPFGESQLRLDA